MTNTCKDCKKWFRHSGLGSYWNPCEELSQSSFNDCFLIPRSIPELKDYVRVRIVHTFREFGCVFFEKQGGV